MENIMFFCAKSFLVLCTIITFNSLHAQGNCKPSICSNFCTDVVLGLDVTLGYGKIKESDESILDSSLLDPLLTQLLNTHNSSGGFAGRVFGYGLAVVSPFVSIGGELGFSYYPTTKERQEFLLDTGGGVIIDIIKQVRSEGYGIDVLLDLAFCPVSDLIFCIKPGFQFAHQSNKSIFDFDLPTSSFLFDTNTNYQSSAFLPEVILSLDWVCFRSGCFSFISTIGLSYQHVFGHDSADVAKRINSRDLVGLNLGINF